jgi:hypothetical protein
MANPRSHPAFLAAQFATPAPRLLDSHDSALQLAWDVEFDRSVRVVKRRSVTLGAKFRQGLMLSN